jgi:hypothetical protein
MTPEQAAIYRATSPVQRLQDAFGLHDFVNDAPGWNHAGR